MSKKQKDGLGKPLKKSLTSNNGIDFRRKSLCRDNQPTKRVPLHSKERNSVIGINLANLSESFKATNLKQPSEVPVSKIPSSTRSITQDDYQLKIDLLKNIKNSFEELIDILESEGQLELSGHRKKDQAMEGIREFPRVIRSLIGEEAHLSNRENKPLSSFNVSSDNSMGRLNTKLKKKLNRS